MMSNYAYSPDTGELIRTDAPADWMGTTDVAPPDFEAATAGCFWRGDRWEIVEAVAPVEPVPAVVTMRQARLALLHVGRLPQVNAAVIAMPGPEGDTARIEWEFSSTVERGRPLVQSLIGTLGFTETQLDDLFKLAATL